MKPPFRYLLFLSAIVVSVSMTAEAKVKASKARLKTRYPLVRLATGKAFLVDDALTIENRNAKHEEKEKTVKNGMILKDKAHIRVETKSELDLTLGEGSQLVILENSEIDIPGIAWENGEILEIRLISGKIRYRCDKDCNRKIVTPIYEDIPSEGDYLLTYDPQVPFIEVAVLQGRADFRGLENEVALKIPEGKKARFTGVLEGGEPAFDVLLKGRKVARGQAGEIQDLTAEEKNLWKKRDEVTKKEVVKVARAQKGQWKASQICSSPLGELNQCAWRCVKNPKGAKDCDVHRGALCERTRCNANGAWSDRTELSASGNKCGLKTIVDVCDY